MACGKIDGYIGKWELVNSIDIPPLGDNMLVIGFISGDEICAVAEESNDTFVINISTNYRTKVIEADCGMYTTSCASVDSNVIVVGKQGEDCAGDSLDGCITLYDRQWKVIRDINIPRQAGHTPKWGNSVYVDVDRDGMIVAAQREQSNIYVINPADGKIVNTITMQGKVVDGEIQALSSGDIVVKTRLNEFIVTSRSGEEKAVIHRDETLVYCSVDKLTDTLYITYLDDKSICTVDQVSCNGIIEAKRIVEYINRDPYSYSFSQSFVTPSGNLVGFYGITFCVYKKKDIV